MTSPIDPHRPSQMPPARPRGHDDNHDEPFPTQFGLDLDVPTRYHVTHTHELGREFAGILRHSLGRLLEPIIMASLADVLPKLLKAYSDQQATIADLRKQVSDATANAGMPSTQEQGFADQINTILDAMDPSNTTTLPTDGGNSPTGTPTPTPTDGGTPPAPTPAPGDGGATPVPVAPA